MRHVWRVRALAVTALLAVAACSNTSGPPAIDYLALLTAQQAKWSTVRPANYAYDYKLTGFFVSFADRTIHVAVRGDTVRTVAAIDAGPALTITPAMFPTMDALFSTLAGHARNGTINAVEFDVALGYPKGYAISGPADGSGAGFVTGLVSIP